jgi:pyrimidine deaminase RibD-like protein
VLVRWSDPGLCADHRRFWITRVVYGIRDPHPRVNGQGREQLLHGGVEVSEGTCAEDIRDSLVEWLAGR